MSWKKNAFSYILWGVYTAAVIPGFFIIGMYAAGQLGIDEPLVAGGAAGLLLLAVLGGFLLLRRFLRPAGEKKESGISWDVVGKIAVVGLLGAGLFVRLSCLVYAGEEASYFDAAMVAEGAEIPQITHGAVYLYLQVLRLLFLVAGNKWMAGIYLQIALQLAACVILYFGVKRLSGGFPALVMTAFLMLSPHQILQGLVYSPAMLYLCVYGIGLLCITSYLERSARGRVNSVYDALLLLFTGALTAFVCYLDITGVTLLLFAAGVLWLRKKKPHSIWGNSLLGLVVLMVSTAGFFCVYLGLDAYASGKSFAGVFRAWQALYQVLGYDAYFWLGRNGDYVICLVMFLLMAVGAVGFWFRKKGEKLSPWIVVMAGLSAFEFLHITTAEVDGFLLMGWMLAVLSGIGAQSMFWHDKLPAREREAAPEEKELVVLDEGIPDKPKVQYIENPLPLPKKHVKKVMDFVYDPKEHELDYDVQVKEDDDFDI